MLPGRSPDAGSALVPTAAVDVTESPTRTATASMFDGEQGDRHADTYTFERGCRGARGPDGRWPRGVRPPPPEPRPARTRTTHRAAPRPPTPSPGPYAAGVTTLDLGDRKVEVWYPGRTRLASVDTPKDVYFIKDLVPQSLKDLIPADVNPPFVDRRLPRHPGIDRRSVPVGALLPRIRQLPRSRRS